MIDLEESDVDEYNDCEYNDLLREVERLRSQVAELRALGVSLHKAAAMGRDAERAAVVAWLNGCATEGFILLRINEACDAEKWALAIERGEHRRREKE